MNAVTGELGLGGQNVQLPRGSLTVSHPRELVVTPSISGAYESDGSLVRDTLPPTDILRERVDRIELPPRNLENLQVVHVHGEAVVWGGYIARHFGHFLSESVSRLWPLLPGAQLAGLPVVFAKREDVRFAADWLASFGIRTVHLSDRGFTRFTRMYVPEPAWRIAAWIAPEIRDIHLHARRGLDVPSASGSDVLWLSRSGLGRKRVAYDEGLLEWILGDRVTVIQPETMSLAEQVAALEGSRAVAGVIGSAFHTMLMTEKPPDCLYLCPPWEKDGGVFPAQHRFLDADATFVAALSVAAWTRRARREGIAFPYGYRILIPETLRALSATVLPGLLDEPEIAALVSADSAPASHRARSAGSDLDTAVARVVADPLAVKARADLGRLFEAEGFERCAREQLATAAELAEGVP